MACSPAVEEPELTPEMTSFVVTGVISGTSINGKKIFCSTVEQTPIEQSQTLTAGGSFTLTFNKTGQIPLRCILANSDNSFAADVVFSETVTRSIKGDATLKHLISMRKSDTASMSLGTISYNGQTAEVSLTAITQDGIASETGSWSDLSGVWSHSSNLVLTTFNNNLDNTVSGARWHQASATDDLGQSHTGLSVWMYDSTNTPTDMLAGCQNKEGYALQAGWTATVNSDAFQIFSDSSVSFASLASSTATAAYADALYGSQDICGIDVGGQTCDVIDFSSGNPLLKGGLNDNQCMFLCVLKSIDALNHMIRPSFSSCLFEYKANLTGDLTTRIPATGVCTAVNGNPCPGLIDKPERVLMRSFFEEVKTVGDTASFSLSRTDNVRSCTVENMDNNFDDLGECFTCGYEEKISVIIRQLSPSQAYASQRISKIPLATNSPTKCVSGGDSSFVHRAGVVGLMNVNDWTLTGNSFSHVYLMTK